MYEQYLELGGTEIANAERVARYVERNAPHIPLRKPSPQTLHEALGEAEYESPAVDDAPWLDASNPATAKFYGVYPLSIRGGRDSTRSAETTETLGGGGVTGAERYGSRLMRVRALLVAETSEGLEAGHTWLDAALRPSNCNDHGGGSCGGAKLCFYSSSPVVCDEWDRDFGSTYAVPISTDVASGRTIIREPGGDAIYKARLDSPAFPTSSQMDGAVLRWGSVSRLNPSEEVESYGPIIRQRTNLFTRPDFLADDIRTFWPGDSDEVARNVATNPSMEAASGTIEMRRNLALDPLATAYSSAGIAYANDRWAADSDYTLLANASDGPVTLDGAQVTSYARATAKTTHGTGHGFTLAANPDMPTPTSGLAAVTAGEVRSLASYWRTISSALEAVDVAITYRFAAAGAWVGPAIVGPATRVENGSWGRVSASFTVPAGATHIAAYLTETAFTGAAAHAIGDTLDATGLQWELSPVPTSLIWGDRPSVGDFTYAWSAGATVSPSVELASALVAVGTGTVANQRVSYRSAEAAYEGGYGMRTLLRSTAGVGVQLSTINPSSGTFATIVFMARANSRDTTIVPRIRGTNGSPVPLPQGVWTEVRATVTVGGASNVSTGYSLVSGGGHQVGDTIDVDLATIVSVPSLAAPYTGPPFSGDSPSAGAVVHSWAGTPNASEAVATEVSYVIVPAGPGGPDGRAYAEVVAVGGEARLEQNPGDPVIPPAGPLVLSMDLRGEVGSQVTVQLLDPDTDAVLRSADFFVDQTWQRYSYTMNTTANFYLRITSEDAFDVSGIDVEVGHLPLPYLDGDQPWQLAAAGYVAGGMANEYAVTWLGTPHKSRSRLTWLGAMTVGMPPGTDFEDFGGGSCDTWPFVEVLQGEFSGGSGDFRLRFKVPTSEQVRPFERTMHDVRCIEGPLEIETLNLRTGGHMRVIEFTLVAGKPWAYSTTETLMPPTRMSELPTFAWPGTDDCSTPALTPLVDPDCIVPPAPPRPPEIATECITVEESVQRYWFSVPASGVSVWSDSVPRVTITSGVQEIRQVRVRAFPNPFDRTSDSDEFPIDPCSWCSEFIVSYLPAQTELTVDAILERAFAAIAGEQSQPADTLLYASDGGPMTWPALSCGIGYIFTVDVPEPLLDDVTISFELARRQ